MSTDWEGAARSMRDRVMWLIFFVGMYATYFWFHIYSPGLLADLHEAMPRWLALWDMTWLVLGAVVFAAWLALAAMFVRILFAGLPHP